MSSGFNFRSRGRKPTLNGDTAAKKAGGGNFSQTNSFQTKPAHTNFQATPPVRTDPSKPIVVDLSLDALVGPLFDTQGFAPIPHAARPSPKYLIEEARQLTPIAFTRDDWDAANQNQLSLLESQRSSDLQGLYEQFQKLREVERKEMEKRGLVHAEDAPTVLGQAVSFRGTCLDMCPTYERVRRALENNVKKAERDPQTGKIARDRAIKAFSRPAAGQPPPLPSDVRPPHVLTATLDYLIGNFMHELPGSHSFIWDRTRSIRQDFTYQNYYGPEAIDCNERIVRIHLVCLHMMTQLENDYSQQQELEQMNKALRTLMEIYDDVRQRGGVAPNEAEFRAYNLLSHFRDPSWEHQLQALPRLLFQHPLVQQAIRFRLLMAQNNLGERGKVNTPGAANFFHEFLRLLCHPSTLFLTACLLETLLNEVRFYAVKAMARGLHSKAKPYPADRFQALLGFNNVDEVVGFCKHWDLGMNGGVELTGFSFKAFKDKPKQPQGWCASTNTKIGAAGVSVHINSGLSNTNLQLGSFTPEAVTGTGTGVPLQGKTPTFPLAGTSLPPAAPAVIGWSAQTQLHPGESTSNVQSQPLTTVAPAVVAALSPANLVPLIPSTPAASSPFTFGNVKPTFPLVAPGGEKITLVSQTQRAPLGETTPTPRQSKVPSLSPLVFSLKPEAVALAPAAVVKPTAAAVPATVPLVSKPHFAAAAELVFADLVEKATVGPRAQLATLAVTREVQARQKKQLVDDLSQELFRAFMSEFVHIATLEALADSFRDTHDRQRISIRLKRCGVKALAASQARRRRKAEVMCAMKFGAPSPSKVKRRAVRAPFRSGGLGTGALIGTPPSLEADAARRTRLRTEALWRPLNVETLLGKPLTQQLETGAPVRRVTGIVDVADWGSSASRWIVAKLGMKLHQGSYSRTVYEGKLKLTLGTEGYDRTAFVLFNCGITSSRSELNLAGVLQADAERLASVMAKVDASCYPVVVVILYWDAVATAWTQPAVLQALGAPLNTAFCDMSGTVTPINPALGEMSGTVTLGMVTPITGDDVCDRLANCLAYFGSTCTLILKTRLEPDSKSLEAHSEAPVVTPHGRQSDLEEALRERQVGERKHHAQVAHLERHLADYTPIVPMRSSQFSRAPSLRGYHSFNSFAPGSRLSWMGSMASPLTGLSVTSNSFASGSATSFADASFLPLPTSQSPSPVRAKKSPERGAAVLSLRALTASIRARRTAADRSSKP